MATWGEFEADEPGLARLVRERFEAHTLGFLATLRSDGAPRISGIETTFAGGHLLLGMMKDSLKSRDLTRDPRLALHAASVDKDVKDGDVKLTGRAVAAGSAEFALLEAETGGVHNADTADLWWVDLETVSGLRIGDPADHLVISSWTPGRGLKEVKRY